jgi:hypothetical protein
MENDNELITQDDTETTENDEVELDLDLEDDDAEGNTEDIEALKKKIKTLEAQKEHFRKKATEKKEETPEKPQPKKEPSKKEESLSAKDALLLAKAEVDIDDVDEVVDFAKYRKITIAEALKSSTLKAILTERAEERRTALAAQTRNTRSAKTPTADSLLDKARKGEIPDSADAIETLAKARMESRLKR